ncbi:Mce protein [Mycolicibacterium holsaticum]|uniref:Mce protein n=1 Tax=Mycolicibacterium holsaticum TaxID=152142 RepID=A0A1E3RL78_9MYCO|nr:Mce protein [Mycolicibacterium holsaticum]ODQ90635.1 Mce protein [Mycolicibacterium holsaticum]
MSVSTDEDRETGEEPDEGDAAEQAEAPDTTEDSGAAPAAPNWRRRALRAAVAAAFVVLAAAVGFLGWQLWQERQITQAGEQARQAATDYAQVLTSIDSEKVDENFDAVLDGATGEFKDMYSQSSSQLRQLLIDNKASAHGVVLESAVQSATKDKAVVLLFVDQSVSNTNVPDPRIDRSRIKMTMEYVDGRWRASKVELP